MRRGRGRAHARRGPRIAASQHPPVAAVVAAGGRGERASLGTDLPKQFRPLGGRPLIEWSLDVLRRSGCTPVVLVVPERSMTEARALFESEHSLVFVTGGETRQDSVAGGLEEVSTDLVVIHDAARPFVTPDLVRRVVGAVEGCEGAVAAMPADETLKLVRDGSRIDETVDRSHLWRAQTPQAFVTGVLREAHAKARSEGFIGTDDASLVERYGGHVKVVQGTRSNIKVTYPEDFPLAEAILRGGLS